MKLVKKFLSIITSLSLLLSVHNLAYAKKILPQKSDLSQTDSTQTHSLVEKFNIAKKKLRQDLIQHPEDPEIINKNATLLRYMDIQSHIDMTCGISYILTLAGYLFIQSRVGWWTTVGNPIAIILLATGIVIVAKAVAQTTLLEESQLFEPHVINT